MMIFFLFNPCLWSLCSVHLNKQRSVFYGLKSGDDLQHVMQEVKSIVNSFNQERKFPLLCSFFWGLWFSRDFKVVFRDVKAVSAALWKWKEHLSQKGFQPFTISRSKLVACVSLSLRSAWFLFSKARDQYCMNHAASVIPDDHYASPP